MHTDITSQVEKQQGQLASYHGLSKTEDQAIDSDEVLVVLFTVYANIILCIHNYRSTLNPMDKGVCNSAHY